jgi:cell division protein FtsB
LDPGKPVKADKAAILSDATRMVTQLRAEAQQLKDTNGSLEDKIKELKVRQAYIHCISRLTICYNPKAYKSGNL